MKKPDIIVFSLPRSHESFSSTSLSLAKELSLSTRVYFINNPYTLKDLFLGQTTTSIRSILKGMLVPGRKLISFDQEHPNLFVFESGFILPINYLPKGFLYNLFSRVNGFLVNRIVRSVIARFRLSDFLFINSFNPLFYYRNAPVGTKLAIYHCVDDITQSKYIAKHGSYLELLLLKKYDLVLTTSTKLARYAAGFSRNARFLPNAADVDLFKIALSDSWTTPAELRGIQGPVIGYIGNLDHRVDLSLLEFLVLEKNTNWTFLFVGPIGSNFRQSKLMTDSRVVLVGPKPLNELPDYLKVMDCCIIPFLCNTLTASIYPLKLNEYLAGGKPVVSTDFSEDLAAFGEVICIAKSNEEFYNMIVQELSEQDVSAIEKRVIFSSANSWKSRAESFWSFVEDTLARDEK